MFMYSQLLILLITSALSVLTFSIVFSMLKHSNKSFNYLYTSIKKRMFVMVILLYILLFSLLFMPVKLTTSSQSSFKSDLSETPDKVIVKPESFNEYQTIEYQQLKKESLNEKP